MEVLAYIGIALLLGATGGYLARDYMILRGVAEELLEEIDALRRATADQLDDAEKTLEPNPDD